MFADPGYKDVPNLADLRDLLSEMTAESLAGSVVARGVVESPYQGQHVT